MPQRKNQNTIQPTRHLQTNNIHNWRNSNKRIPRSTIRTNTVRKIKKTPHTKQQTPTKNITKKKEKKNMHSWDKQPYERNYDKFQEYLLTPHRTTLKQFSEDNNYSFHQIRLMSGKNNWKDRKQQYVEHQNQKLIKQRELEYLEEETEELQALRELREAIQKNTKDIQKSEIKPTTKAHAYKSQAQALTDVIRNFRLIVGKSTENVQNQTNLESTLDMELHMDPVAIQKTILDKEVMQAELEYGKQLVTNYRQKHDNNSNT